MRAAIPVLPMETSPIQKLTGWEHGEKPWSHYYGDLHPLCPYLRRFLQCVRRCRNTDVVGPWSLLFYWDGSSACGVHCGGQRAADLHYICSDMGPEPPPFPKYPQPALYVSHGYMAHAGTRHRWHFFPVSLRNLRSAWARSTHYSFRAHLFIKAPVSWRDTPRTTSWCCASPERPLVEATAEREDARTRVRLELPGSSTISLPTKRPSSLPSR